MLPCTLFQAPFVWSCSVSCIHPIGCLSVMADVLASRACARPCCMWQEVHLAIQVEELVWPDVLVCPVLSYA